MTAYKLIHKEGKHLTDLLDKVEGEVQALYAKGFHETDALHIEQCGCLYIVWKELEKHDHYAIPVPEGYVSVTTTDELDVM